MVSPFLQPLSVMEWFETGKTGSPVLVIDPIDHALDPALEQLRKEIRENPEAHGFSVNDPRYPGVMARVTTATVKSICVWLQHLDTKDGIPSPLEDVFSAISDACRDEHDGWPGIRGLTHVYCRPEQASPHIDSADDHPQLILYLGEDSASTGTAFFQEKTSGLDKASDITPEFCNNRPKHPLSIMLCPGRHHEPRSLLHHQDQETAVYEETARVHHRSGRIAVFRGSQFHSPFSDRPERLSCDPRKGRLAVSLFFAGSTYPKISENKPEPLVSMSDDSMTERPSNETVYQQVFREFVARTALSSTSGSDSQGRSDASDGGSPLHLRKRRGAHCGGDAGLCCDPSEGKSGFFCKDWGPNSDRCGSYHECRAAVGMLFKSCCVDNVYPSHICGVKTKCPTCGDGLYRVGCAATSSGTCKVCPACKDGEWRKGCVGQAAGKCEPCQASCGPGNYLVSCGLRSPGRCTGCEACPEGYIRTGCEASNPGVCNECGELTDRSMCTPPPERMQLAPGCKVQPLILTRC